MKKFYFMAVAVAAMSLFASCEPKNNPEDPTPSDTTIVTPGDTIPADTIPTVQKVAYIDMLEELIGDTTAAGVQAVATKYGWACFSVPGTSIAILAASQQQLQSMMALMMGGGAPKTIEEYSAMCPFVLIQPGANVNAITFVEGVYNTFAEAWTAIKPASDYAYSALYTGVFWSADITVDSTSYYEFAEGTLVYAIDSTYSGPGRAEMIAKVDSVSQVATSLSEQAYITQAGDQYGIMVSLDELVEDDPTTAYYMAGTIRVKSYEPVDLSAPKKQLSLQPLKKLFKK